MRGRVAGGHAFTRVHVGARVGHHVAVRSAIRGPTGIVGTGEIVGAVTRKRYTAPIFKLHFARYFFRVGLCSHTFFIFQATWRHGWRRI